MSADTRFPTNLLTGFLGSGKTTLLNSWLRSPLFSDAAVIVNEFGEIGIDHELIASSNDNTIELSTGCLCCTVRGDLVNTLRELYESRERGEVRAFNKVFIETTGLADPVPVVQALMTFPVARKFVLNRIITAVDSINGMDTLDRHPEAVKQVAVADEIVLTKSDLTQETADLSGRLSRLNPGARQKLASIESPPLAEDVVTGGIYDPSSKTADVSAWLNAEAFGHGHDHDDHHNDGHNHDHHHHDINRHDERIGSFCLTFDEPLAWEHIAHWLDALVIAHAENLLRVKGILNIAGREKPIVVQAVQRLFHPPFELPAWPDDVHRSRIVFITRDLSRQFVSEVFETIRSKRPQATH